MALKAGINGFGRIGRNVFRAAHERGADIDWVGVNDITDTATLANLLKYDSILGPFPGTVQATEDSLIVDRKQLRVFAGRGPVDRNIECPFLARSLQAGARSRNLSFAARSTQEERSPHEISALASANGRRERDLRALRT